MHATMATCRGRLPAKGASTSPLLWKTLHHVCPQSLVRRSASNAKLMHVLDSGKHLNKVR